MLTAPVFVFLSTDSEITQYIKKLSTIATIVLFLIVTIVPLTLLGLVFWKIHSMTRKYVGLFNNRKLIFWHFAFFLAAGLLYTFSLILVSIVGNNEGFENSRIDIAGLCLFMLGNLCWLVV